MAAGTTETATSGQSLPAIPFDHARLDALMEEAGLDALLVTSKHNIQYLLGGYRFFFFDYMDAIGTSRYLPVLVYVRGRPDQGAYVGNPMESWEQELGRFWMSEVLPVSWGTLDAVEAAARHVEHLGSSVRRIGIEPPFLPADAYLALARALPSHELADAHFPLERLRAQKTPAELDLLRQASERVVDAMQAVFASHGPGSTKQELASALRREEQARDLTFEYCLIATGRSFNRAPESGQRWEKGQVLSLDSGGNYQGYIGDLCRMAVAGEPDQELQDLLSEIDAIQQAARRPIRAGALGQELYTEAEALLGRSAHRAYTDFVAHGMGIVSHEAPRLIGRRAAPYRADERDRPLAPGMVLSIETTMKHPTRGFIKLEDTVAVTRDGWEAFGDTARGWNRAGGRS
ncbi:M24 family metallopeptidase [Geminicoccus roseus]|uniref:M24 family metallopeptidase n=1 Tax=Geminicoccus roseus TaxID=404900 RepID=UPI0004170062|nr:Xaa-Pro peptidase family protein [Geminicoccus roseus]